MYPYTLAASVTLAWLKHSSEEQSITWKPSVRPYTPSPAASRSPWSAAAKAAAALPDRDPPRALAEKPERARPRLHVERFVAERTAVRVHEVSEVGSGSHCSPRHRAGLILLATSPARTDIAGHVTGPD
jgi:hypothetical protein